ncbi:unnamed protein product [Pleuronectes platessa]|uniref:Uncharacterized protein n=1 Tax=Pleuronectes platessa TaxID=8262 RepID=A0A9N7YXX8_PLEPL|nr:unnamed protein product [Pleuronectes platessa]
MFISYNVQHLVLEIKLPYLLGYQPGNLLGPKFFVTSTSKSSSNNDAASFRQGSTDLQDWFSVSPPSEEQRHLNPEQLFHSTGHFHSSEKWKEVSSCALRP